MNHILNNKVAPYCGFTGMKVNTAKAEVSTIDYNTGMELSKDNIRYKDVQLVPLQPTTMFKYLGLLLRLYLNDIDAIAHVKSQTSTAVDKLAKRCYTTEQLLTLQRVCIQCSDTQLLCTDRRQRTW